MCDAWAHASVILSKLASSFLRWIPVSFLVAEAVQPSVTSESLRFHLGHWLGATVRSHVYLWRLLLGDIRLDRGPCTRSNIDTTTICPCRTGDARRARVRCKLLLYFLTLLGMFPLAVRSHVNNS